MHNPGLHSTQIFREDYPSTLTFMPVVRHSWVVCTELAKLLIRMLTMNPAERPLFKDLVVRMRLTGHFELLARPLLQSRSA